MGQNEHCEIDEGQRLLRTVRRGAGSAVTRRPAQRVLLSAQVMFLAKIADVTFTSADRVRDVIHGSNLGRLLLRRAAGEIRRCEHR